MQRAEKLASEVGDLRVLSERLSKESDDVRARKDNAEKQILEYCTKVSSLEEIQKVLSAKNDELKASNELVTNEIKQLRSTSRQLHEEKSSLDNEKEQLSKDVQNFRQIQEELEVENANLKETKAQRLAQIEDLEKHKVEQQEVIVKYQQELQRHEQTGAELSQKYTKACEDRDKFQEELRSCQEELQASELLCVKNEELQSNLQAEKEELSTGNAKLQAGIELARDENEKLGSDLKTVILVKETLAAEKSALQNLLDATKATLEQVSRDNAELQASKNSFARMLEEIKTSSEVTDSERLLLVEEKEKLLEAQRKMSREKQELTKQIEVLVEKLRLGVEDTKAANEKIQLDTAAFAQEKQTIQLKLADTEKTLQALEEEKISLKSAVEKQNNKQQNLEQELSDLKEKYEKEISEKASVLAEKKQLEADFSSEQTGLKSELDKMKQLIEQMDSEKRKLRQDIEELQTLLQKKTSDVESLEKSNVSLTELSQKLQLNLDHLKEEHAQNTASLEKEKIALNTVMEELKKTNSDLLQKADHLSDQNRSFSEAKSTSEARQQTLEMDKKELSAIKETLSKKVEELTNKVTDSEKDRASLSEVNCKLEGELESIRMEKEKAETEQQLLRTKVEQLWDSLNAMCLEEKANLQSLNQISLSSCQKVEEIFSALQNASEEKTSLAKEIELLKTQQQRSDGDRSVMAVAKEALASRIAELENTTSCLVKEKSDLLESRGSLELEVLSLRQSVDIGDRKCSEHMGEIDELKKFQLESEAKLRILQDDNVKLEERQQAAEEQAMRLSKAKDEMVSSLAAVRAERDALRAEKEKADVTVTQLEARNQSVVAKQLEVFYSLIQDLVLHFRSCISSCTLTGSSCFATLVSLLIVLFIMHAYY